MNRLRTLLGLDEPQETRFFLLLSAYGLVIAVVYWFLTYEVAGSVLLLGFGITPGIVALRLAVDPTAAEVRRRVDARGGELADLSPERAEGTGGGTGGIDRPFLDESGRLPSPTLAPFAVGLGLSTIVTGIVFGPAPVVAGILPFAWGAWTWLRGANDEYRAVAAGDVARAERGQGVRAPE